MATEALGNRPGAVVVLRGRNFHQCPEAQEGQRQAPICRHEEMTVRMGTQAKGGYEYDGKVYSVPVTRKTLRLDSILNGTMAVRNAAADGYTLLLARIASHVILPATDAKTPYQWNDFTLLSVLGALDGRVTNAGVARYRTLRGDHASPPLAMAAPTMSK